MKLHGCNDYFWADHFCADYLRADYFWADDWADYFWADHFSCMQQANNKQTHRIPKHVACDLFGNMFGDAMFLLVVRLLHTREVVRP